MKRCTRTKSRRKREVITGSLEDDNLYNFIELDNKEVSDNYATNMSLLGEISTDFEEMEKIAYAHCVAESAVQMPEKSMELWYPLQLWQ